MLALREAFAAARLFTEARSYSALSLDVYHDEDSEPEGLFADCEKQAQEITAESYEMCRVAAEKLARAADAVSLAENFALGSSILTERQIETRTKDAARLAVESDRSERAVKAASARHAGNRDLRELATRLYEAGSFRSIRQAAKQILPQVQARASELGIRLSEDRGEKTVYDWLLQAK